MFENIKQPYPFNNNFKHNLRTIVLVSMAFMLLLLYFQPFGINFMESKDNGYFVLMAGLVNAVVLFVSTLIIPGFFPQLFNSERWTVGKEIIWNSSMFILLIGGFALTAHIFKIQGILSLNLFHSGALALLPLILFNLVNYNSVLKTKITRAIDSGRHWLADDDKASLQNLGQKIQLSSENKKEEFELQLQDLILIQSSSNYIEIYFREGKQIKRQLMRQTLTEAASQLKEFDIIQKCHRCCLVNLSQISRIIRATSGYELDVEGLDFQIPVSRSRIAEIKRRKLKN
jgi:hypothetical protein